MAVKKGKPKKRIRKKKVLKVRPKKIPQKRAIKKSVAREPVLKSLLPCSKKEWEKVYAKRNFDTIPWNLGVPATELKAFLEMGLVPRGRALDVGCGTGSNTIMLAKCGFHVIGIDCSPSAIALAKDNAKRARTHCTFWIGDALHLNFPTGYFDFVFDRGCFNQLGNGNREKFIETIARVLAPHGWYQLVVLSPQSKDPNKFTKMKIQQLFSKHFDVQDVVETSVLDKKTKKKTHFLVAIMQKQ
ncbi:MAG: methyltransferase domain-containing protein [Nanoarchaeota archaeon]|nr:methyltransferase domain-containing protein [Nanoarchaeota archaeon]